jgi:hypothetical protein
MSHRSKQFISALNQTAVYWGSPVSDGQGGRTFDAAVEIAVRWEEKQVLFIDATGQEVQSKAVVYPDQDIDRGGYLYLGSLADLSDSEILDPLLIAAAFEVRQFMKSPNRRATDFLRKVML